MARAALLNLLVKLHHPARTSLRTLGGRRVQVPIVVTGDQGDLTIRQICLGLTIDIPDENADLIDDGRRGIVERAKKAAILSLPSENSDGLLLLLGLLCC